MSDLFRNRRTSLEIAGVCLLLVVLALQIFLTIRDQSQTWDEADHIFAGYMSLKNGDFGLNPEHPPLVKMLAATPILWMPLNVPQLEGRDFKEDAFLRGKEFLYSNDADAILLRTRLASGILTLLCALVLFLGTREMFGTGAGFIALTLFVFDPNLLAHGAYVTTDAGSSLAMFATVYAFYRYVKAPSWQRLAIVGLALGLALSIKHSAVLLFPILFFIAVLELLRGPFSKTDGDATPPFARSALRWVGSLAAISVMSIVILWAFYGFRYQARPDGLALNPTFAEYTQRLSPAKGLIINTAADLHVLPESYLYGLTDVLMTSYSSYVMGETYPHSVWFYFPVVFVIKSTLGFLLLFLVTLALIATRKLERWREIVFLTIAPLIYFLVAMNSGTNIGVRHLLPVYVFLFALVGGAVWLLISRSRLWVYALTPLIVFHIASSVLAFPYYIPYSNEFWGGSSNTWKYLSDSNIDWAQQLKQTKRYLDEKGIKECWFVYFGGGIAEPDYYGIPCKPLPTIETLWLNQKTEMPPTISGTVLMSAVNVTGFEFGPGRLNPYEQFKTLEPKDVIAKQVFVYEGTFEVPLAAALVRAQNAQNLLRSKMTDGALSEAAEAVRLAPDSASVRVTLGDALQQAGRTDEARTEYQAALRIAKSVEPDFQAFFILMLEQKLSGN